MLEADSPELTNVSEEPLLELEVDQISVGSAASEAEDFADELSEVVSGASVVLLDSDADVEVLSDSESVADELVNAESSAEVLLEFESVAKVLLDTASGAGALLEFESVAEELLDSGSGAEVFVGSSLSAAE